MPSSRSRASATKDKSTSPKDKGSPKWPEELNHRLEFARQQNLTWDQVADRYFQNTGKSGTACRKRWERMVRDKRAEELAVGDRLQDLAQAYFDVRKEMWTILADRLGEDWEAVESRCMEKGFKNLRAAANSARRSAQASSDSGNSEGDLWISFEQEQRHSPGKPTIASMLAPPYPDYFRSPL